LNLKEYSRKILIYIIIDAITFIAPVQNQDIKKT